MSGGPEEAGGESARVPDDDSTPAPRGIRPEEVALLIKEIAPVISGARVEKVHQDGSHAFRLVLRARPKRVVLLVSTRPGFSRFHVVTDEWRAGSSPSDEVMALRELLRGGTIGRVDQPGGDRIVRVDVEVRRDGDRHARQLILELFGVRGRLVVCEGDRRVVRFVRGRGGLSLGDRYAFPKPPPAPRAELRFPFDPRWVIPETSRGEPLAFNLALARAMAEAEQAADRRERYEDAVRRVQHGIRRRRQLLKRLDADREAAAGWEEHQRRGELLKAERHRLRRGLEQVKVTDYFDPAMPTREISLDPAKSPAENIEACFRRARKAKRSIPRIDERRSLCQRELETLNAASKRLEEERDAAATEDFLALLQGLERGRRSSGSGRPGKRRGAPVIREPFRRYRSREGLEVLAGRSARDNDRLTLRVARGNDLFFHLAHRPGPHVIVRVPRGKHASPETILDAAFLAAYLSGWRGPGYAVVNWTEVKYVRKVAGAPVGQVFISRDREVRVPYTPDIMARLSTGGAP